MDTIGVYYIGGTNTARVPVVILAKAALTGLALYPNPIDFTQVDGVLTFKTYENFIRVLRTFGSGATAQIT